MLSVVVCARGHSFHWCSTWSGGGERDVRGRAGGTQDGRNSLGIEGERDVHGRVGGM